MIPKASHHGYHIPDYADKVYVIEHGEIVFGGTVAEARVNAMVSKMIGSRYQPPVKGLSWRR